MKTSYSSWQLKCLSAKIKPLACSKTSWFKNQAQGFPILFEIRHSSSADRHFVFIHVGLLVSEYDKPCLNWGYLFTESCISRSMSACNMSKMNISVSHISIYLHGSNISAPWVCRTTLASMPYFTREHAFCTYSSLINRTDSAHQQQEAKYK